MAVSDRWHKQPKPGDQPCREHSRGRTKLYPSADHMHGDRWQVRWRDPAGKQRSRNFAKKEGKNPDLHAEAFDAQINAGLDAGTYTDPELAKGTFGPYAEQWRKTRTHDTVSAEGLERRLRLHVHEGTPGSGRTPRGGPALGHLTWEQLGRYPSLTQAWIAGLKLGPAAAGTVVDDVSSVFAAAIDDGLISRNPTRAKSVRRPETPPRRAVPWGPEKIAAVEAALPGRYRFMQRLGPSTGMRQGEVFGLDVDDVDFLKRAKVIRVRVQVRIVGGRFVFSPLKNAKDHDVPIPDELAEDAAAHLRLYPAAAVTLPWDDKDDREKHGRPVTRRLVFSDAKGRVLNRSTWDRDVWKPALAAAGIIAKRERGQQQWAPARAEGTHAAWRHTAASAWLAEGVSITDVAEWLGDTVETVYRTYAHMMPGADERGRAATSAFLAKLRSCARDVHAEAAQ